MTPTESVRSLQSLAQLDAVYDKTRATVLRDNMESQIYYRPSNQETADYLAHCLGSKSDYAQSETLREGAQVSIGLSEQGVPLMTAQEIKQLPDEEIIGFHRLLPPFKARRMDWRHHQILADRRRIAAPGLPNLPQLESSLPTTVWQGTNRPSPYIDPDKLN